MNIIHPTAQIQMIRINATNCEATKGAIPAYQGLLSKQTNPAPPSLSEGTEFWNFENKPTGGATIFAYFGISGKFRIDSWLKLREKDVK